MSNAILLGLYSAVTISAAMALSRFKFAFVYKRKQRVETKSGHYTIEGFYIFGVFPVYKRETAPSKTIHRKNA